ncbi:MAG: CoA-acylating methylmalonate-semialdehyde dehydrogenase [Gammaproteobacteria bacterium]|nr:CoA-acylating methylmalonate-semialdehyde dehydrogenase [Gammaproteobacteria bacterium]
MPARLLNYVNGAWREPGGDTWLEVTNPATAEVLATVPLTPPAAVDEAAQLARAAFPAWRRTPATARVQYLFALKQLLEQQFEELARSITLENGKNLADARGELRRAIENVETACGIPMLMMGDFSEDVASGLDEHMVRQPVGVAAIISPFNFPGMIPFWYLPYALATGNSVIVKPSERCPITMQKVFGLLQQLGLPPGVVNLVNGGAATVDALLDHPAIAAVAFVGSTPVARHVYARASASGKRVQAQGGAKNPLVILPDADPELTTRIVTDSAFGNAGQRCLAASLAITVAGAERSFAPALAAAASRLVVGNGLDPAVQMGPVITARSRERIESLIGQGLAEGARALVDGRNARIAGCEQGYFLRPTLLAEVPRGGTTATTEIFGPVLGLLPVATLDEAIQLVNGGEYGNMACVFTSSGAAARKFRYEADAGNIGINIGVAAPMAFYPFSGWKSSFFGTLHAQGRHAVEFFTQTKVVVERWQDDWSRKF